MPAFTRVLYTWVCSGIKDKQGNAAQTVLFLEDGTVQVTCKGTDSKIFTESCSVEQFKERFDFDLAFEIAVQRQADSV
jgi:hypothetical protein